MKFSTYPSYKPSGVEYLDDIPINWHVIRIKFLASEPIKNGVGEPADYDDRQWPRYVRISDLDGPRTLHADTFRSLPPEVASQALIKVGDLLFAAAGATYGKSYFHCVDIGPACFAGYLVRFAPGRNLVPAFAAYWAESLAYWRQVHARVIQATIQNFSAAKYRELLLAVPPLPDQEAIVLYLDRETARTDALLERKHRLLELVEEKRLAIITQAVTKGLNPACPMKDSGITWLGKIPAHWILMKLKFAASVEYGVGGEIDNGLTEGINLISLPNVLKNGELDLSSHPYCELDTHERETLLLRPGDLLFNWRNGSSEHLGKTAVFNLTGDYTHVSFLLRIRVQAAHDPLFLRFFLNGLHATKFFSSSKAGVNNTFNKEELKNLWIMLPPKLEQQQIANFISNQITRLDGVRKTLIQAIEKLQQFRSALITNAVTGKIDVRGLANKGVAA